MGTIIDKLEYTKLAVDDIQAAINEKKVQCEDTVPLKEYGDKIRAIKTHQKPTFCPWYDFENVYYGFDETDITYTNEFYISDKPTSDNYDFGNTYTALTEDNITYTNEFVTATVTPKSKSYTNI